MKKIYYISTKTCAPCRLMSPLVKKVSKNFTNSITFETVSLEKGHPILSKITDITHVPTILVLNEKNKEIERMVGLHSEKSLTSLFKRHSE